MSWAISKEFRFEAAHALTHLPREHKCHRLHGHSYRVVVILVTRELDARGFAGVDYAELDEFGLFLEQRFDHQNLNTVVGATGSTAENLAKFFFDWCKAKWAQTVAVRVYETPKTCVEYNEV